MKKNAKLIVPVLIIAVAMAGFSYLRMTRPQAAPEPAVEKVWPVFVSEARLTDEQPVIREFGTVVAGSVVELRPLVEGRIVELGENFVEGAAVRRGETLAVIDPVDYEIGVADRKAAVAEAEARLGETRSELRTQGQVLEIARAQVKLRKTDLERKRGLAAQEVLSKKALDDARIAYNDARQLAETHQQTRDRLAARIEQLKASLLRTRAALEQAEHSLGQTRLMAPEDGFLADTSAAVGQHVGNRDRLARLLVIDRLEVLFRLTLRDFGRLSESIEAGAARPLVGRPVTVNWRAGPQDFAYEAVIDRLGPEIDPASGGVGVYARILQTRLEHPLRPGAFVEISMPDNVYADVLRLPQDALHDGDIVYVIEEDRLVPRSVQLLRTLDEDVLVRTDILPGTQIVVTRFPEMGPGLRVEAR